MPVIPMLKTLQNYSWELFKSDSKAGITTAIMLVPQAMAYAMLAGLDPIIGLYASTIPTLVYALLGTSRHLAVGPVAMDSILVALSVAPLAGDDPIKYAQYASLLMLMVGLIHILMGACKLGRLTEYLSKPLLSGFVSAAAIIIIFAQLKNALGISMPNFEYLHQKIVYLTNHLWESNFYAVGIAVVGIVSLAQLKQHFIHLPRHLLVIVGSAVFVFLGGLSNDVSIIGQVPEGLPSFTMVHFDLEIIVQLIVSAIIISLIAFMEAYSVGTKLEKGDALTIDANQELLAIGSANAIGAFFQGYPITGGFSRSTVNYEAGAKTTLAGFITAIVIISVLLFLTPALYYIPKPILAAIIISAVSGLFDGKAMKEYYANNTIDFTILITTFAVSLFVSVQLGLIIGICVQGILSFFRQKEPEMERKTSA